MNKSEMVKAIAQQSDLTQAQSEKALEAATNAIKSALSKGDTVSIAGLGSFTISERSARTGRNPQTGETIQIAASKAPKFKAAKPLKEAVQ